MSTIGAAGFTALNLAGSLAGAQSNNAGANERAAEADGRRFSADLNAMSAQSLEDVSSADLSGDRDADGRRGWELPPEAEDVETEALDETGSVGHTPSDGPTGRIGRRLDVRI